jgi:hypothetical protein
MMNIIAFRLLYVLLSFMLMKTRFGAVLRGGSKVDLVVSRGWRSS